jgi:O-antigen/teichoic acid export membrane protein
MNLNRTQLAIFSGYAQIASAIGASLLMVPLALRHLNEAEFGLWVVIGQSLGFLLLLDFGLGNSAGRILADPIHKKDEADLTAWWTVLVSALGTQGLVILLIGVSLTRWIPSFLELPQSLAHEAQYLWLGMVLFNALARPINALHGVYYARNKVYVVNTASLVMSWSTLAFFSLFLSLGYRTQAYMYATILAWTMQASILFLGLAIPKELPRFRASSFQIAKLKSLYAYSFWTFLMAISIQMILMSQSLIISKVLGIATVAAFSVSVKAANMLSQILWKTFGSFSPTWLRSHVEGNHESFLHDWTHGLVWTVSGAMILSAGFITFNRTFVGIYAREDLWAGHALDLAAGAWVILYAFVHAASLPFVVTKNVRALSLVSVAEAPVSLLMGVFMCKVYGLPGLYIGGIIASALFAAGYLWRHTPAEAGMKSGFFHLAKDHRIIKSFLCFLTSFLAVSYLQIPSWLGLTHGEWLATVITAVALLWMIHSLLFTKKFGTVLEPSQKI